MSLYVEVVAQEDISGRVVICLLTDFQRIYQYPLCMSKQIWIEGWAQDYGKSNIFLKPLFRGKFDPFVNNANLGAIAHMSNGT